MSFKAILNNLLAATPGANGAVLADLDGEAIDLCCSYDSFELKIIGAHGGILLNRMKKLGSLSLTGEVQETVVTTGSERVVIGAVGKEYMLVVTLDRDSMVGQALHNIRESIRLLEKEIY